MFDLAALGVAAVCFAFAFLILVRAGASLMSAADVFGLVVSLLVLAYLVYALFRGEKPVSRAGHRPDPLLRRSS